MTAISENDFMPTGPSTNRNFLRRVDVDSVSMINMRLKTHQLRWLGLLAVAFVAFSTQPAGATVRTIGSTANFAVPDLTDVAACSVFTRATAFQVKSSAQPGFRQLSRVPANGSLVAWSLALPKVLPTCTTGFNAGYSGGSTGRISVLRRAPVRGRPYHRYKLVAQSPSVKLRPFFGSQPSFALDAPIRVARNDIIAVTTDTWLPAFTARPEDAGSSYRASRPAGKCAMKKSDDYINGKTARMHTVINQIRIYGCAYTGARLHYNATVVDTPNPVKAGK